MYAPDTVPGTRRTFEVEKRDTQFVRSSFVGTPIYSGLNDDGPEASHEAHRRHQPYPRVETIHWKDHTAVSSGGTVTQGLRRPGFYAREWGTATSADHLDVGYWSVQRSPSRHVYDGLVSK